MVKMTNVNITSIFYILFYILVFVKKLDIERPLEFRNKASDASHDKNLSNTELDKPHLPPHANDVLWHVCNWLKRSGRDHRYCLITFIPCGDFSTWLMLENRRQYTIDRNDSILNIDEAGHHRLLEYQAEIGKQLNTINMNILQLKHMLSSIQTYYLRKVNE